MFNMVLLELVDWEEIFKQIRIWCTFNPFIVYLCSSFALFQQKEYEECKAKLESINDHITQGKILQSKVHMV